MISAEQVAIVMNDVRAVIQTAHSHVLLAVQRNPVPEQFLLHFARGIRCDWNFIFARTQSEDAKATDSPENCVGKSRSSRSESLGRPWESAFVEIDQVGDCENVGAIGDAVLLFPFIQHGSERIAPPKFQNKSNPDEQVTLIRLQVSLKEKFEYFLVSLSFDDVF